MSHKMHPWGLEKTLTTMRVLPLQINQGILRHPNIIRIMKKHYMYDSGIHLGYVLSR